MQIGCVPHCLPIHCSIRASGGQTPLTNVRAHGHQGACPNCTLMHVFSCRWLPFCLLVW